jgi:poly(3-hydroxybutyrate) depolymerase
MAENHEVWITDWADAKMVPLDAGHFDLDDYIDYLIEFLRFTGPGNPHAGRCASPRCRLRRRGGHGRDNDPCRPATLTMMGARSTPAPARPRSTTSRCAARSGGSPTT